MGEAARGGTAGMGLMVSLDRTGMDTALDLPRHPSRLQRPSRQLLPSPRPTRSSSRTSLAPVLLSRIPDSRMDGCRSWKVKQAEEISRREEESATKKEETIVKAQNAIDNFYKDYNSKKEKNIARNKYVLSLLLSSILY